jgi:hypothetical protein
MNVLSEKYVALAEKIAQGKFTAADQEKLFSKSNINNMKLLSGSNAGRQSVIETFKKVLSNEDYLKLFSTELGWVSNEGANKEGTNGVVKLINSFAKLFDE